MYSHWPYRLAGLAAALAVAFAVGPAHHAARPALRPGITMAGPICPAGTNWDNILHVCA